MVESTIKFLNAPENKLNNLKYEIIIVNDGSKDNTWNIITSLVKKYSDIVQGVNYDLNGGKGYAVATGMKFTRGANILMADADGAHDMKDYIKMQNEIKHDEYGQVIPSVIIGSRHNAIQEENEVNRSMHRKLFGLINNFIVRQVIGLKDIKDTQCGFKLLTRKAAREIVFNLHLARWAFDVEMLYLAKEKEIKIVEVPVSFVDVEGSKLNVMTAAISFLRDYAAIIVFYSTGLWNVVGMAM